MNLKSISDFLHFVFDAKLSSLSDTSRAKNLEAWLFEGLFINDGSLEAINNLRVAVSIAFDIKSGNMTANDIFERVLSRKDEHDVYYIDFGRTAEAYHTQFHRASHFEFSPNTVLKASDISNLQTFYHCEFFSDRHPPEGYIRCISLPVFFTNYISKGDDYKSKSNKLEDYLDEKDWHEDFNFPVDFPEIQLKSNVNMRGGKPLAWIAPAKILNGIKKNNKTPLLFARRLGIFIKDSPDPDPIYRDVLVLMKYKSGFTGRVYQPSSFHADWMTGGFVNYKKNRARYGLTFNCNERKGKGMNERIHLAFPIITKGPGACTYEAEILGRVRETVILYYNRILLEAYERFNKL